MLVKGDELGHGAYPRREELARAAGLVAGASQTTPPIRLSTEACCRPGSGCWLDETRAAREHRSGLESRRIAAFDEFSKLLGGADATRAFDHVIFDTAPTGHTLRLLELPAAGLDAPGQALLEEDLRSPCTEETAVFRAFADTVAQGEDQFVVIDTAPTGHTLLLLDAAEAFHREVLRKASGTSEAVERLLPRLRDPQFTMVLLVTLPEATPIHEAMQLERDLARADITPFAWVVNQSLTPLKVSDPVLRARHSHEAIFASLRSTGSVPRGNRGMSTSSRPSRLAREV